jgi:hypothetical protein
MIRIWLMSTNGKLYKLCYVASQFFFWMSAIQAVQDISTFHFQLHRIMTLLVQSSAAVNDSYVLFV